MAKSQTISVTAVPGQRISVGINYPWAWNKYGGYFGSGVTAPGANPEFDAWLPNLDQNLGQIADIISVVRIFLLCNCNNLGTTKENGQGPLVWIPDESGTSIPYTPWTAFVPPTTVSPIYVDQLKKMLTIFGKHSIKVMPCLTDFSAFAQGPKGDCRTDIITDPTMTQWFIQNIVDPFLDAAASVDGGKSVFAWDIMNEPGQVTDSYHFTYLGKSTYAIARDTMASFLTQVAGRIKAKGFKSTVGHHYSGDLDLPTGDFPQFHYYPQNIDQAWYQKYVLPSSLPLQKDTGAFIGEFQSAYVQKDQTKSVIWPEVAASLQSGSGLSRTISRLQLIEAKGYGLALLWPDLDASVEPPNFEPLHYSQPVLDGIRAYVKP